MAITYKELKRLIRFKCKDNNKIRFSDYDIKMSVNEVLRYVSNSYALQNTDFLEKMATFDEKAMNEEVRAENKEREARNEELAANDSIDEEDKEYEEYLDYYHFADGGVELPDDFISLQGVIRACDGAALKPAEGVRKVLPHEYKIMGDRLYLGVPYVRILYKAALPEITDDKDEIPVPQSFTDYLVKLTCMILENNASTDVMREAVDEAVASIVPRRRYVNARIKMPFRV